MTLGDSHYRWVVVGYTLVIQGVSIGMLIYSFALFAVPWLDLFAAPRRDVMLTVAILQLVNGAVSPIAGRAMDRYSIRTIVLAGLALMLIGLVVVSRAQALWQVWLVYATLFPVSMAMMSTLASQTLVTRWFDSRRGLAIGVSAMGTNLGGIVFPLLIAGWLTDFGWRDTFVWLAVTALVLVGPLSWFVLGRAPSGHPIATHPSPGGGDGWTTRAILSTRRFWIPGLAILPLNLAFGAVQYNLGVLSRDLGLATGTAANLIALHAVCMIAGKFFFGSLGDRIDHRYLFWLSAGLMGGALVVLQGETPVWMLVTGIVMMGLAGGGILPMFGMVFGARFGVAAFGRVMGLVMTTMTIGALGPLMAGWAYDLTGSYDLAFQAMALLLLPAALAMIWLPEPGTGSPP